MADDLDRVRISAAELRAEASNFVSVGNILKEVQEPIKRQKQREGKRPDLQRYQPGVGQSNRRKSSTEGEAHPAPTEPALSHAFEEPGETTQRMTEVDLTMSLNSTTCHGCPGISINDSRDCCANQSDCQTEPRNSGINNNSRSKGCPSIANHQAENRNSSKEIEGSIPGPAGSPKQSRKTRKPDREIYQPGGRRSQNSKDSGPTKELDRLAKEGLKKEPGQGSKFGEKEGNKGFAKKEVESKEDKVKTKQSKEGSNRQEQGKQRQKGVVVSVGSQNCPGHIDNVIDSVEKLSVNSTPGLEARGRKGEESEDSGKKRRKASNEGRRSRAGGGGGGEGGTGEAGEKRKEKGGRRGKAGKEKGINQTSVKREVGEGCGKGSEVSSVEKEKRRPAEESMSWELKGKQMDKYQEHGQDELRRNWPKDRNVEEERALGGKSGSKMNSVSKRYSKSDIRRSRNRTYSTSSASSGTSMEGHGEADRRRAPSGVGGRERNDGASRGFSGSGATERNLGDREWSRGNRCRRRNMREVSSTDSFDENEAWEDDRKAQRSREVNEDRSPGKRADASKATAGGGRGGILRVSLDKQSGLFHVNSGSTEEQSKRRGQGPRGRGRGILVLPAHTDLNMSPETGTRVMGGMRGGMGLSRGRSGRGGGTRRLWDPNNPDQKPALARNQQAQPLQQALYLQQHGGYSPLHFLDTDDETAGSPPVHQGEQFKNQQAAAVAYYKFQNSDNPYCYPLPASAPNPSAHFSGPYRMPYQMPGSNGIYSSPTMAPLYGAYGLGSQGYPGGASPMSPEEAEVQARGELGKLLRLADSQELQLSNLLSRDSLSPEGLDRMGQLRAELLTLYERVILTDIEFSDSQNLDQALWKNVFYQVIERFRQLLKDTNSDTAPRIRTLLLTLLDEGAVFFDALLQKLQAVFQFKLEDYMDGLAIRARPLRKTVKYALISAQRCMICQGDIARYREQASDSANYGKARSWYLKAQQIAPKNGRPYNQLALLAVYTKRKLDAVYYYMRSLAASNPILTAKESLMSLFEEAKRKADQLERRRQQHANGRSVSHGHAGRGGGGGGGGGSRGDEGARVEIWVRPNAQGSVTSREPGNESGKDSELDGELGTLTTSDLNKRFILSFLHTHGKLFTKVGMESFPAVAARALMEFRALLQHSPSPLGNARMLQIVTINMCAIYNAQSRADGTGETRSALEEQTTSLGLAMFGLLVQRCTELLKGTPAVPIPAEELEECEEMEEGMVRVSSFPADLRELLPSVKVWSDWMLGHPDQWNPPPSNMNGGPDVWRCLAELCNGLARVHHGEAPLYKADAEGEADEELRLLALEEDRLLAGLVPLLAAPQEPCYVDGQADTAMAADCKRVTVLKYFLEALCGQEEPLLAFKGGKYVSMATPPTLSPGTADRGQAESRSQSQEDDVIVEDSSLSASDGEANAEMDDGSEDDIRELLARRQALAHKLAQQQKRQHKIQAVLQTCRQLELEIRPFYLVPDTNCFIDHLDGLRKLMGCGSYVLVVPLIVITELDGLAKGQESREGVGGGADGSHARLVQERAKASVAFLERGFEAREPGLRALTSRGSQLESIAFRSEDTSGQQGNNDDVILSCCLHYCKDKAKDFMPTQKDGPVRLRREVVLLTDDRNLRVKALTRNVPVRDIPAFLSWAKVG